MHYTSCIRRERLGRKMICRVFQSTLA
ncbi:hypothetical protein M0804_000587 [Polistes exclamans]|nr:hypothetical protein M0804_000587 [Polistes exclamans]